MTGKTKKDLESENALLKEEVYNLKKKVSRIVWKI